MNVLTTKCCRIKEKKKFIAATATIFRVCDYLHAHNDRFNVQITNEREIPRNLMNDII